MFNRFLNFLQKAITFVRDVITAAKAALAVLVTTEMHVRGHMNGVVSE